MNEWRGRGGLLRDMKMEDVNGLAKASFTIAVNGTRYDSSKREQVVKATYVSCEAWGHLAEKMYQDGVGKGCDVLITGELTQTKHEGDKDAKTRIAVMAYSIVRMSFTAQQAHESPSTAGDNAGGNPWASETPPR